MRQLIGLTALAVGVVIGLYGLFAISYKGDTPGGGDTYFKVGGKQIDADLFGVVAIVVAGLAIGVGIVLVRGRFARRLSSPESSAGSRRGTRMTP